LYRSPLRAQQSYKKSLALAFSYVSEPGKCSPAFELNAIKGEKITICHRAFLCAIAIVPETSARWLSFLAGMMLSEAGLGPACNIPSTRLVISAV
jgi:hypothetical protein